MSRTHIGIWKMNIYINSVNVPPTTYNVKRLPNITILEDVFLQIGYIGGYCLVTWEINPIGIK